MTAAGGFDGVLITFGEGCDDDTWHTLFGHLALQRYPLKLTFSDGTEVECVVEDWTHGDSSASGWTVAYRPVSNWTRYNDGELLTMLVERPLSDLVGIEVF